MSCNVFISRINILVYPKFDQNRFEQVMKLPSKPAFMHHIYCHEILEQIFENTTFWFLSTKGKLTKFIHIYLAIFVSTVLLLKNVNFSQFCKESKQTRKFLKWTLFSEILQFIESFPTMVSLVTVFTRQRNTVEKLT